MARLPRLDPATIDGYEKHVQFFEESWGFAPNSLLTLAHVPELMETCTRLAVVIMQRGKVPLELKWLVAHVTSLVAGCRYCSAHSGFFANELAAIDPAKIETVWNFESSPAFDEAERAALRVAADAGVTPNATTDEDFASLRAHFDDHSVAEIVAVIALFGFFNRWNDTVGTDVEEYPGAFEREHLDRSPEGRTR